MSFTPVIPSTGLSGWNFLKATLERQSEISAQSPGLSRDIEYFEDNISAVETLDDLMGDRQLLKVALGAYGLSDELDKGAYVRRMLEEGLSDDSSFANRLNNTDYINLVEKFDFEGGTLSLSQDDVSEITELYKRQNFETDVGDVDDTMRLALNFERKIGEISSQDNSEAGGWFKIMGSVPLRTVIETAFNLPSEFSALDIDAQAKILADKAQAGYGSRTVDIFNDPEVVDDLIKNYLLREQIDAGPSASTPGYSALSMLNGTASAGTAGLGSSGLFNILLSNY